MAKMTKQKAVKRHKSGRSAGELADALYASRLERYELQHKVEAMKTNETAIKERLRAALLKIKGMSVGGKKARVTLEIKPTPMIDNWDVFFGHVAKTKEFDLLQKRFNESAIKERWEQKTQVPGIKSEPVASFSVEKLKGSAK